MIKAVFFDLDGVLVDADYWHYAALNRALAEHNLFITEEQHLHFFKGIPTRVKLKILSIKDGLDEALHETINSRKQEHSILIIEELCKPVPHKVTMMDSLKEKGYQIGVCTNSIRHTAELMLHKSGLLHKVDFIFSNEDVKHSKPDPEIYFKALSKAGVLPEEALIVEDSLVGLKAAQASGAFVCKVNGPEDVTLKRVESAILKALETPSVTTITSS